MRIETNNPRRISHKIRKRIDVVIEQTAIAIIDDELNSPQINLAAWTIRSTASITSAGGGKASTSIHFSARRADKRSERADSVFRLANICRTEIEALARGKDLDAVEIFAAKGLTRVI